MELSAQFQRYFRDFCGVEMVRKLCGKFHFRIRKSNIKFHIKVRIPHFKLRKALLKGGLERNCKNNNVLMGLFKKKDI